MDQAQSGNDSHPFDEPLDKHGHRCREAVVLAVRAFLDLLDSTANGEVIAVAAVRRIAKLARIRVDDADLPVLAGELNSILGWIEQLNAVNIDGVAPLTGATSMAQALRADVVNDGGYPERVLANAPDRSGDFFTVPKVVE